MRQQIIAHVIPICISCTVVMKGRKIAEIALIGGILKSYRDCPRCFLTGRDEA